MPIKMNKPGDTTFAITIEDRFDPQEDHVVEIVDMDTRDDVSTIDGKPYTSIVWKYRIFDSDGVAFIDKLDGSAYEGWEFSSMSLTPKAKARAWASAFIGHELTDDECDRIADNFDGAIVGKRARVSWKVEEKANGTRIRFALLRPMLNRPVARPAAPPPTAPAGYQPRQQNGPVDEIITARPSVPAPGRETAAQRRARLEAEIAAIDDDDQVAEDNGGDDDLPF